METYPRKRRTWPFIAAAAAFVFCVVGVIASVAGGNPQPQSPGTAVGIAAGKAASSGAPKATPKKAPPPPTAAIVGEGTWSVPGEVKPGTYTTTADGHCYWARLADFDGGFDSIVANGNLDPGARGRIAVKASDKGLELTGDCVWTATK